MSAILAMISREHLHECVREMEHGVKVHQSVQVSRVLICVVPFNFSAYRSYIQNENAC